MRRKIICEIEKCLGCRSCQIACALSHSGIESLAEAISIDPLPSYRLKIESTKDGTSIPVLCRHCKDAPCVAACKFEALVRDEPGGPVLLKVELCKGCKKCVKVCPYGILKMEGEGKNKKVVKCDFCIDRQIRGEEPACVVACPTKALKFIKIEDKNKVGIEGLKDEDLVEVTGTSSKLNKGGVEGDQIKV